MLSELLNDLNLLKVILLETGDGHAPTRKIFFPLPIITNSALNAHSRVTTALKSSQMAKFASAGKRED